MTEATMEKNLETAKGEEKPMTDRPVRRRTFSPRVDIFEAHDNIVVVAEMPGVSETTVEITLEKNVLTIKGEVPVPQLDGYKAVHVEYPNGNYARTFKLSEEIDQENIEASVENGLLTLLLPKAEMAIARKIAVKSTIG